MIQAIALICLVLSALLLYFLYRHRYKPEETPELKCLWKNKISRPWPLDVSEKAILSASPDTSLSGKLCVSLWNLKDGSQKFSLSAHNRICAARGSFSSDGKSAVFGNEVWDMETAKLVSVVDIPSKDLKSLQRVYSESCGSRRVLALRWRTEWQSLTREYTSSRISIGLHSGESGKLLENVFCRDWSKEGKGLKEGKGFGDTLSTAEPKAGQEIKSRAPDFARMHCALSSNRELLAVHARDKHDNTMRLIVWKIPTGKQVADLTPEKDHLPNGWCNMMKWAPDNNLIATSYVCYSLRENSEKVGYVRVWDTLRGENWMIKLPKCFRMSCMSFAHGDILAFGGFDGCVTLVNAHTSAILARKKVFGGIVHRICVSPNGSRVLATGSTGESRYIRENRGSVLTCLEVPHALTFAAARERVGEAIGRFLPLRDVHGVVASYVY